MKCFLRCPLAGNTSLFWQEVVILSQEICYVKLCPPSPPGYWGFLCPLLVSFQKKNMNMERASQCAYALFRACMSSQMFCTSIFLFACIFICFLILFWRYRYDSCMPRSSCLCFVSTKLAGPCEVEVSKPNVYTALTSKRTKHSCGLLPASWPIRGGSQQPIFIVHYCSQN